MSLSLPIALDAMGGDKAPESVIHGARIALKYFPDLEYIFYGDEALIAPLIHRHKLTKRSKIHHTQITVDANERPSIAIRKGRNSSMHLCLNAVANGEACAAVSSGNTGALMAMAKIALKTLPGILRPAITATIPAKTKPVVLLDMGANIACSAEHLVQFALMGDAYAKAVLGVKNPKIGLLNVGEEEMKGHSTLQDAHHTLKNMTSGLGYHGFVEGNDLLEGKTDVVVTDGFTGNVALKTTEGASRLFFGTIQQAIESSFWAKAGYLLARSTLKLAFRKFDPRKHNGAMFLGLNGIAIKSHGGADAKSFANAIKVAATMVEQDINQRIIEELRHNPVPSPTTASSEAPIPTEISAKKQAVSV
jgi:glycerol-3-phosphate acyltransferase PlsX